MEPRRRAPLELPFPAEIGVFGQAFEFSGRNPFSGKAERGKNGI